MQGSFDKTRRQKNYSQPNWTVAVTAACWVLLLALVALISNSPVTSNWVSNAAQAKFDGSNEASVQIAQPVRHSMTFKAD